jgi:hypothetical protein
MLLREGADFDLARRVRSEEGAALGEVYAFLSGLYFRGKLAYARAMVASARGACDAYVIVPGRGLLRPEERVRHRDLLDFAAVPVDASEPRYRRPLEAAVEALLPALGARGVVVLLGSIASAKYVDVLEPLLGPRLRFPREFVGRGDMSRGGLLLRCAREGRELDTVPVSGTVRTGRRPPRLPREAPGGASASGVRARGRT